VRKTMHWSAETIKEKTSSKLILYTKQDITNLCWACSPDITAIGLSDWILAPVMSLVDEPEIKMHIPIVEDAC